MAHDGANTRDRTRIEQRGYFEDTRTNCSEAGDIALTIVAGPLNYLGVNPKVDCADIDVDVPEPSK